MSVPNDHKWLTVVPGEADPGSGDNPGARRGNPEVETTPEPGEAKPVKKAKPASNGKPAKKAKVKPVKKAEPPKTAEEARKVKGFLILIHQNKGIAIRQKKFGLYKTALARALDEASRPAATKS